MIPNSTDFSFPPSLQADLNDDSTKKNISNDQTDNNQTKSVPANKDMMTKAVQNLDKTIGKSQTKKIMYYATLTNDLDDYPICTQIPRRLLANLLRGKERDNGRVRLNNRFDISAYILMFFIQISDGASPYFDIHAFADAIGCTAQTAKTVLKRLEQQKLVTLKEHPEYAYYYSVRIVNYTEYFKKKRGGYVTIYISEFAKLCGILNYNNNVSKACDINAIRAKLMVKSFASDNISTRVSYMQCSAFFPRHLKRRGLLSAIIMGASDIYCKVSKETRTLPNFYDLIGCGTDQDKEKEIFKEKINSLEKMYNERLYDNSLTDAQNIFLSKLISSDNETHTICFQTESILKFCHLFIKIGKNKFEHIFNNIERYVNCDAPSQTFTDCYGNPITNLFSYLALKTFSICPLM